MTSFHSETDADGIATVTWDLPGRSMNVMTLEGLAELEAAFDAALADPGVKAILLTSAKKDFAGGMDLSVLGSLRGAAGETPAGPIFERVMGLHRLLRKIERAGMDPKALKGGKPVAAALPGTALGIGLELPLACHRIFAADVPGAKIGLPEIMIGIFPGAGGTTRLVRKLGVMAAAPYLLEGRLESPAKMAAAGVIDAAVPPEELLPAARAWLLAATDADLVKPWDARGYRMPGGAPYDPAGFMTFLGASAMVNGRTQGAFPAAKALLSAAYEGALVPFDTALRIEARWFTSVMTNPSSEAMIRSLFLSKEALEKGANRPELPDQSVRRLGVIGAGMMGAGIAHVAALAGIEVVLVDASQEGAERGKAHSAGLLDKEVQRRRRTPEARDEILARITPTTDHAALAGVDLVVEAVFEDPKVKAGVIASAEAAAGPGAIFATNTSTLPITALARASARPGDFIGIHFFSPVEKMLLVEIIRGRETGDRAVARALDFVRQIRKTPIIVNDARFFYANRCILPYINEGVRMVSEGVAPALVENAARQLGFPLGPLQLVDEVSIELGVKIAKATRAELGDAYPESPADDVIFRLAELGRLGRKAKAGFYSYDDKGTRLGLWPGLPGEWPPAAEQPPLREVQDRLAMVQALEAVRALEEGVLTDVREGDVGAVLGWGFMPWSGGPFGWLDILGAGQAVARADALAQDHGSRFAAPPLLRRMAAAGERFYPPQAAATAA